MMSIASTSLTVLLLAYFGPSFVQAQPERYLYNIYYSDDGCGLTAQSIIGLNHDESDQLFGVDPNLFDTITDCSEQSICFVDNNSDYCRSNLNRTYIGLLQNQIGDDRTVFQCDESNEDAGQPQCRFFDGCYGSSVYPSCYFVLRPTSLIIENPDLIANENAANEPSLELTTYMILYSDPECEEMEGMKGVIMGSTDFYHTPDTMSCEDSVACLINADGEACVANGNVTGTVTTMFTKRSSDAPIVCDDETDPETCRAVDPGTCAPSSIYPSCYVRHTTAKALFTNPAEYVKTKSDVTVSTSAPTGAPTGTPASFAPQARSLTTAALAGLMLLSWSHMS